MEENPAYSKDFPIDVVIAWVDGSDPKHTEKRNRFIRGKTTKAHPGAQATRFASINEIRYCILSILKFAPFVRNIYIVTDEQDPNIYDDVRTYFPERLSSIRIVDHKEIFEGYEKHLPTFNSISIGNMIWRIKGISNNFVYFNDDTFLIRPMKPEDWFINNKPVLRGRFTTPPYLKLLWNKIKIVYHRHLQGKTSYQPRASFHVGQWNSASLLKFRWRYLSNSHTPHTVGREQVEEFFGREKKLLEKNISYRFRNSSQFTFISLSNHLQILNGNRHIEKPSLAYLQPYKRSKSYVDNKIRFCEKNSDIKYICVQSLDLCTKDDQYKVLGWMESILNLQPVEASQ